MARSTNKMSRTAQPGSAFFRLRKRKESNNGCLPRGHERTHRAVDHEGRFADCGDVRDWKNLRYIFAPFAAH